MRAAGNAGQKTRSAGGSHLSAGVPARSCEVFPPAVVRGLYFRCAINSIMQLLLFFTTPCLSFI